MMDKIQLALLLQIIDSMEEAVARLEGAYKDKNVENAENAKKTIMEFQKRLNKELGLLESKSITEGVGR